MAHHNKLHMEDIIETQNGKQKHERGDYSERSVGNPVTQSSTSEKVLIRSNSLKYSLKLFSLSDPTFGCILSAFCHTFLVFVVIHG